MATLDSVFFPAHFRDAVTHSVVFSGDLTAHYLEVLSKLKKRGMYAFHSEGLWEVPQLAGFDETGKVVLLVNRITGESEIGESEYLVSSLNHQYIAHLNRYEIEDDFFNDCVAVIGANLQSLVFRSFVYDADGNYQGEMAVTDIVYPKNSEMLSFSRELSVTY